MLFKMLSMEIII